MPARTQARRHKRPHSRRNNSSVKPRNRRNHSTHNGRIAFTKMHGLGNDFVVLDCISSPIHVDSALVKAMGDRHFGIGCDQLLVIDTPRSPEADFSYRIFNADGNEVEHCGNGARCFAKYVFDKRLTRKREILVDTKAGRIVLTLRSDKLISVNMGVPNFEPEKIPLAPNTEKQDRYQISLASQKLNFWALSIGNPHAVIVVDDVATADVEGLGRALQNNGLFPQSVNVGFLEIDNECAVKLRVYERGAGETLACGSGACAAVVAGIANDYLSSPVTVQLPGGQLEITWAGDGEPVIMTGPAESVFSGHFDPPKS